MTVVRLRRSYVSAAVPQPVDNRSTYSLIDGEREIGGVWKMTAGEMGRSQTENPQQNRGNRNRARNTKE